MKLASHQPDMSCARRSRHVRKSCGTNDTVVSVPATKPVIVMYLETPAFTKSG